MGYFVLFRCSAVTLKVICSAKSRAMLGKVFDACFRPGYWLWSMVQWAPVQLLTRAACLGTVHYFPEQFCCLNQSYAGGGEVEKTGEFGPVFQLQPSLLCASAVIDGLRHAL